jgi:hypothetical protein
MHVLATEESDESLRVTACTDTEDDHRFELFADDGDTAVMRYQETLSWRGNIRVSDPSDDVYKAVATAPAVTEWLNEKGLDSVRREVRN